MPVIIKPSRIIPKGKEPTPADARFMQNIRRERIRRHNTLHAQIDSIEYELQYRIRQVGLLLKALRFFDPPYRYELSEVLDWLDDVTPELQERFNTYYTQMEGYRKRTGISKRMTPTPEAPRLVTPRG